MPLLITPSILAADLTHLQDEVDSVASADWLQIDVMDGHFVASLTFGAPVLRHLRTSLPLDIHLMVTNPLDRVAEFLQVGAKNITFHAEAALDTRQRREIIGATQASGATAGIALKPQTPLTAIDDILDEVDLVLLMSVEPGRSGQEFQQSVLPKIKALRTRAPTLMIQVDGGIDDDTAQRCVRAGADNLVAASFIFSAADRAAAIRALRAAAA